MFFRAWIVFEVGRGDYGAVREQFQAGIAAIHSGIVVEQFHAVLSWKCIADVGVSADPGHEMPLRGAAGGHVAENEDEFSVRELRDRVPVAGKAPGRLFQRSPGFPLIVGEHHQRAALALVFPGHAHQYFLVRGIEYTWLAGGSVRHLSGKSRLFPGKTAVVGD